ncbi:hypothetical protein [Luteimonas vadosa]|uniref:Uncharacterized protein n=1 Tax=Luteimonas vadosa TaxID=1165507 RepID=A0ABP9DUU4_9GAMM
MSPSLLSWGLAVLLACLGPALLPLPSAAAGRESEKAEVPFLGGFIRETRIVYPLEDSGWRALGEQLHEPHAAGVSVFYADIDDDARRASVHYQALGLVSEQDYEAVVAGARAAFESVPDGPGSEAAAKLGESRRFSLRQTTRDGREYVVTGTSFDLEFHDEGERFVAAQTVLWSNLYLVRWMMVAPAESTSRDALRRELERWTTRMVLQTGVVSTGDCWMPMRIETARPGRRRLHGQMATIAVKGDGIIRVMPDRLLVPESIARLPDLETAALMYAGMRLAGRLVNGCVSPVDMNLEVGEGFREIRLEYSEPETGRDTIPSFRLRSRNSGIG